jgi:hypothetical protein
LVACFWQDDAAEVNWEQQPDSWYDQQCEMKTCRKPKKGKRRLGQFEKSDGEFMMAEFPY